MGTFALDASSSSAEIVEGLNYAIANLGTSISNGLVANVLVANISTGEITTTSSNSSGYTNTNIVSYLYQYMGVKYANTSTGSSGFTSNSRMAQYYGLRNSANTAISSNPVDYVWFQAAGGFGTTKNLWYQTIGGRQIDFFVGNAAPTASYIPVPDMPLANSTPLNLDSVSSAQNNQIVNVNAFIQGNTAPATPAGGSYNFATYVLTPPTGWSATIPAFVANTSIYVSQAAFVGNSVATVGPATLWSLPVVFSSQFQGNTGAPGERGFVPLGFVVTASDPTTFTNTDFTNAFQASRANPSPPIGLGYAPIAGDTAQFFYQNLFNPNLDVTIVRSYDGAVWSPVNAEVVSGGLIVPGTITANTLNANQVYAVTIQSTNANIGDNNSNGYWFQANTGNGRFGGNLNIGNQLTIGANAVVGGNLRVGNSAVIGTNLIIGQNAQVGANLSVGTGATIGTNLAVGANAQVGANLTVGTNAVIGANLAVGANAAIGSNLTVGINATIGADLTIGSNATIGNDLVIGNNATIGNDVTIGANLSLGANLNIGDNLIVGNNAAIGSNLTVAGLITTGSLNADTVNTDNLIINSATQTIALADNSAYPTIAFVNGANTNPASPDFLWPDYTRGFALGGGVTITANTTGSPDGSKILVNYNGYIHSATNPEYNLVELWKSGASNFYRSTFNAVRAIKGKEVFSANIENFIVVGDNGSFWDGNVGNLTQYVNSSNKNMYDGWPYQSYNNPDVGMAFGQGSNVIFAGTTPFVGNLAGMQAAFPPWDGSAYPLFDIYGISYILYNPAGSPSTFQPTLCVGSGGTIQLITGTSTSYGGSSPGGTNARFTRETSGTFAELRDISADVAPGNNYVVGDSIRYVAVGTGGTILYNTRTYTNFGRVNTSSGWAQAASPTLADLNGVGSNFTANTDGNVWVLVGDRGTVLRSTSYSGPYVAANVVPTAQNLQAVDYANGYWVAVGDAGTIITSTDADTWYGPVANPADGTDPIIGARNLNGVAGGELTGQWIAAGEEIILTSNTTQPNVGGWNSGAYLGGSSVRSQLTRVQFFGSWANIANVSQPPVNQRVSNQQVVSGNYTDVDYNAGDTITYYLVLGNLFGNVVITTNQPNMTITEIKR